jgi:diphthamide biosynthesis methyltransferase
LDPGVSRLLRPDAQGVRRARFSARQRTLEADTIALLERFTVAGSQSLVVPGEYLEVVITKR